MEIHDTNGSPPNFFGRLLASLGNIYHLSLYEQYSGDRSHHAAPRAGNRRRWCGVRAGKSSGFRQRCGGVGLSQFHLDEHGERAWPDQPRRGSAEAMSGTASTVKRRTCATLKVLAHAHYVNENQATLE